MIRSLAIFFGFLYDLLIVLGKMKITVSVPATSANIGPGYDIWGIALNLRNSFSVDTEEKTNVLQLHLSYSELCQQAIQKRQLSDSIAVNDNVFVRSYIYFFNYFKKEVIPFNIHADVSIPWSRGLGSSATAIVGALTLASHIMKLFYSISISKEDIFKAACLLEGHPDNVSCALWGGLVVNVLHNKQSFLPVTLPFQAPLQFVAVIPTTYLSTSKARGVIADQVPISDVGFQSSRIAVLTYLFGKKNWTNLDKQNFKICLSDRLHQEKRLSLIPAVHKAFKMFDHLSNTFVYLSGSGSTCMLLALNTDDMSLEDEVSDILTKSNLQAKTLNLEVDKQGALLS